jgi:integrase
MALNRVAVTKIRIDGLGQVYFRKRLLAYQTGLRVSELIALTRSDINLDHHGAEVRCDGKGRKERATPLTRQTVAALRRHARHRPLASWLINRGADLVERIDHYAACALLAAAPRYAPYWPL